MVASNQEPPKDPPWSLMDLPRGGGSQGTTPRLPVWPGRWCGVHSVRRLLNLSWAGAAVLCALPVQRMWDLVLGSSPHLLDSVGPGANHWPAQPQFPCLPPTVAACKKGQGREWRWPRKVCLLQRPASSPSGDAGARRGRGRWATGSTPPTVPSEASGEKERAIWRLPVHTPWAQLPRPDKMLRMERGKKSRCREAAQRAAASRGGSVPPARGC